MTPGMVHRVGSDTLLIIDEAGKAATLDLDAVIGHALARGASVRLIGDDGQLSSISAGGVLRDIAAHNRRPHPLRLVRFASPAEGAATLAIRAGDPAGHRLLHRPPPRACRRRRDRRRHGLHRLGRRPRRRPRQHPVGPHQRHRRRTQRPRPPATASPPPTRQRRDGREVMLVRPPGRLRRRPDRHPRKRPLAAHGPHRLRPQRLPLRIIEASAKTAHSKPRHLRQRPPPSRLPADYVAKHVTLGYATTIDAAQGLTAGHGCHIVGGDRLTRQLLYVALTRGRIENHIYLSTAEADPHRVLSPKATHPDTAVDVLSAILARDGAQISATTAARDAADPFTRLAAAADMYYDALGTAAEHHLGPAVMARASNIAADQLCAPASPTPKPGPCCASTWRYLAAAGHDPLAALARRRSPKANSPAPPIPPPYSTGASTPPAATPPESGRCAGCPPPPPLLADDPQWGTYLHPTRRTRHRARRADPRHRPHLDAGQRAPHGRDPVVAANPELAAEIAVFRAAHNVAPDDTRLTGPEQYAARTRHIQQLLDTPRHAALRPPGADTRRWHSSSTHIDPRIRADAYWPQLASHLATQPHRAGADLPALVRAAATATALPDELPAAALWWRLAGELTSKATLDTPHTALRPPWTADLHTVFGIRRRRNHHRRPRLARPGRRRRRRRPHRWTPRRLLNVAAEHLADIDPDHTIPPYEYARADHLHRRPVRRPPRPPRPHHPRPGTPAPRRRRTIPTRPPRTPGSTCPPPT